MKMFFITLFLFFSTNASASINDYLKHERSLIEAASKTNTDPTEIIKIVSVESKFTNSKNSKSSASGLGQFTNGTWKAMVKMKGEKHGVKQGDKHDPLSNLIILGEYINYNREYLESHLRRPIETNEIFIAHLLGTNGAYKILKAPNSKLAADLVPAAAKNNRYFFYTNGKKLTVQEFKEKVKKKIQLESKTYISEFNSKEQYYEQSKKNYQKHPSFLVGIGVSSTIGYSA